MDGLSLDLGLDLSTYRGGGSNLPANLVTFNGSPVIFNGFYVTYTP